MTTKTKQWLFSLLFSLTCIFSMPLSASEHGGGGGGPQPTQITINIGKTPDTMRVLQVTMVFEYSSPEIEHELTAIKPKVTHELILLLSGTEPASLQTVEGKKALQASIIDMLNELIHAKKKEGVKDVFFTQFIIAS